MATNSAEALALAFPIYVYTKHIESASACCSVYLLIYYRTDGQSAFFYIIRYTYYI